MAGVVVEASVSEVDVIANCGVNIKTEVLIAGVFDIVYLDDDIVYLDTGPIVQYRESIALFICDGPSATTEANTVTVDEGTTFVMPKIMTARFYTYNPEIYLP